MQPWTRFAVTFAAIAAIVRMVIYYAGLTSENTPKIIIMVHLMLILLAIFFTLRSKENRQADPGFQLKTDLKNGIKAGGIYTILITFFVFIYFKFIDSNYLFLLKQQRVEAELKLFPNADAIQVKQITESAETLSSLSFYCTVTTLGLLMVTFTYTILMAALNRFVFSRIQ